MARPLFLQRLMVDLPLSEQVKAMGEEANCLRIMAFCDAL